MKRLLIFLFFFFSLIYVTEAEGNICNLSDDFNRNYKVLSIRQNIYSTGGYILVRGHNLYSGYDTINYKTINVKTCDTISSIYLSGFYGSSESSYIDYNFFTTFNDFYYTKETVGSDNIGYGIIINRDTGIIQNTTHNLQAYINYKVLNGYLRLDVGNNVQGNLPGGSINGGCNSPFKLSLTNNTITCGTDTEGSYKTINARQYTCLYLGSDVSSCFYKRIDNTGIYYTLNDNVDYSMLADNGILNWNLYYLNSNNYLIGDYGSNYNEYYLYNTSSGVLNTTNEKVVTSVFSSGGILYNASVDVPYSNNGFPVYEFNSGGWPIIWTDKDSLISYYMREGILYNNNTGALISDFDFNSGGGGGGGGGGSGGSGTIDLTQCKLDIDDDGDVSFLDGEFFIGLYNCVVYAVSSVNNGLENIYNFTDTLNDFGDIETPKTFTSFIFGIQTANASEMTESFNNRSENTLFYKITHFIMYGIYTFAFIGAIFFIITIIKSKKE